MPPQSADDDPLVLHESEALTMLAHLVTSAELCHSEPWDYGTFRLIDAASRLGASVLPRASAEGRAFLAPFLADVETAKERSTLDREAYLAFLREASRRTAEHLVTRASTGVEDRPPVVAPTPGIATAPKVAPAGERVPAAGGAATEAMPAGPRPDRAEVVLETIRSRRVTRDYGPDPVSQDALDMVLEAARWATSRGGRRVHPLLVVRDLVTVSRLRAVDPGHVQLAARRHRRLHRRDSGRRGPDPAGVGHHDLDRRGDPGHVHDGGGPRSGPRDVPGHLVQPRGRQRGPRPPPVGRTRALRPARPPG